MIADVVTIDDVSHVASVVTSLGHHGGLGSRVDIALRARRGQIDLPLFAKVDTRAIEKQLGALKSTIDQPPTDAKMDMAAHAIVPDHPGLTLDVEGGISTIEEAIRARVESAISGGDFDATPIVLEPKIVPARMTAKYLGALDISTVIASYETSFQSDGDQAPRGTNIQIAAKKIDGLILMPNQLVSFNDVVGERSVTNGFQLAWEIFRGEMRPGVGGGTCQVASTLYAASYAAGLDIAERYPHSRPSAYIPLGLDSTVVFPIVDLKMRNTYDFPVVVHAVASSMMLRVELLGGKTPVKVGVKVELIDSTPFTRKLEDDTNLEENTVVKKQAGIRGFKVRKTRTWTPTSGSQPTRTEVTVDDYPATPEIYRVHPGQDPRAMPPLPDDTAKMLEREGKDVAAGNCEGLAETDCTKVTVKYAKGLHETTTLQDAPAATVSLGH
jgi:vancomycin resistance protein YoaR